VTTMRGRSSSRPSLRACRRPKPTHSRHRRLCPRSQGHSCNHLVRRWHACPPPPRRRPSEHTAHVTTLRGGGRSRSCTSCATCLRPSSFGSSHTSLSICCSPSRHVRVSSNDRSPRRYHRADLRPKVSALVTKRSCRPFAPGTTATMTRRRSRRRSSTARKQSLAIVRSSSSGSTRSTRNGRS